MFRSERPQQGRQRQFYQIGVEAIGSDNPFIDAEVIALAAGFLEKLGIKNFHVKLNSLGCREDKINAMEKHKESFRPHLGKLCETCNARFDKNVLRIFDCKEDSCKSIAENIRVENALCSDCAGHFEKVKEGLDIMGIEYAVDHKIVRGIDYYTKTVFEITQEDLGAKDAICAGGRYNNLVKELGGKDTPAIGFAFGMERLVLALGKTEKVKSKGWGIKTFIAVTGEELYGEAFKLLETFRRSGIASEIDYDARSLKAQMRKAEKIGAKFVVILGEEEFKTKKVIVRDMGNHSQKEVELEKVAAELRR
jgi:histidyl-tRNA synthetase